MADDNSLKQTDFVRRRNIVNNDGKAIAEACDEKLPKTSQIG